MMSTLFILGLIREDIDSKFLLSRLKCNVSVRSDYENSDLFRDHKTFNDCYEVVDFSGCKDVLQKTLTIFLNY